MNLDVLLNIQPPHHYGLLIDEPIITHEDIDIDPQVYIVAFDGFEPFEVDLSCYETTISIINWNQK